MVPPSEAGIATMDATSEQLFQQSLVSHNRYHEGGGTNFLTDAIALARRSLQLAGPHNCAETLHKLGFWHSQLYDRTQDEGDLATAVSYSEQAITATSSDHQDWPVILNSLACRLFERYSLFGCESDLSRSISLGSEALAHADQHGHHARPILMNGLSNRFKASFGANKNLESLESAIRLAKASIACTDPGELNALASRKTNLGSSLRLMYDSTQKEEYLLEAIAQQRDALKLTEDTSPMKPARLCNLGNALGRKYQRTYSLDDLQESISCHQEAVDLIGRSTNQSNRPNIINSYSVRLLWRFEHTGNKSDLNTSLTWIRKLVDETDETRASWSRHVGNLCNRLITRYEIEGDPKDVHEAVTLGEKILRTYEQASASRSSDAMGKALILSTMSGALGSRYRRTSALSDLDQAMRYAKKAVVEVPPTHIYRPVVLENMSLILSLRHGRFEESLDLDKAIDLGQEAADKALEQDKRGLSYSNVGILYGRRYNRGGDGKDLDMAVTSCEKATELGVPHFSRLVNLAYWLRVVFQDRDKQDYQILDRAIDLTEKALRMTKDMPHCPERSKIAINIADARELRLRSKRDGKHPEDRTRSKAILEEMMELQASPAADRIDCALFLAKIASSEGDWVNLHKATEAAVKLFPFISPRCVQQQDQQYTLSPFSGLACRAASAALLANKTAAEVLQLLERGRCVISNHRFERRVDTSLLKSVRPDLAGQFESLCKLLDPEDHMERNIGSQVDGRGSKRYGAEADLLTLIDEIRQVEGFQTFLDPKDPKELLRERPNHFIVVINVSFRSDALLVKESGIELLPLDDSIRSQAMTHAEKLRSRYLTAQDIYHILQWLWDMVAGPIMDALGTSVLKAGQDLPHICWIPTGPLSSLPLHAAGHHLDKSQRTVMDRVISSYSPSIKFMEYSFGNSQRLPEPRRRRQHRALIASMPHTTNMLSLPNARREAKAIGQLLQQKICINEVENPSRSYIRGELHHCTIFHFAGHAKADHVDPLQSCLAVGDGVVTVEDLIDEKLYLDPPLLAYLSACSTGSIQVDNLVEEGIHLAGTFLAAGFQNVIASLWKVSDSCSAEVAGLVYQNIMKGGMDSDSVSRGLHVALLKLREKDTAASDVDVDYGKAGRQFGPDMSASGAEGPHVSLETPYSWVSYIHMGYQV